MPTVEIKVRKEGNFDLTGNIAKVELQTLTGMRQLVEDVVRTARPITPLLTGDLRKDVEKSIQRVGGSVKGTVKWGRPYAWYQERGYTSGPVKKYTTPGTQAHFAKTAVDEVTSSPKEYFGKKI